MNTQEAIKYIKEHHLPPDLEECNGGKIYEQTDDFQSKLIAIQALLIKDRMENLNTMMLAEQLMCKASGREECNIGVCEERCLMYEVTFGIIEDVLTYLRGEEV